MPVAQAHSRLRESIGKCKALLELAEASARKLDGHALDEAILHQIGATLVALAQTIAEAHGIQAAQIQGLRSLQSTLAARQLVSREAEYLATIAADPDSWWALWTLELDRVMQPKPLAETAQAYGLIGSDRTPDRPELAQLRSAHYRPWVESLTDFVATIELTLFEA